MTNSNQKFYSYLTSFPSIHYFLVSIIYTAVSSMYRSFCHSNISELSLLNCKKCGFTNSELQIKLTIPRNLKILFFLTRIHNMYSAFRHDRVTSTGLTPVINHDKTGNIYIDRYVCFQSLNNKQYKNMIFERRNV